jgi:ADP-ribose pyrophosphatase YjhB (NUDIX family)
MKQITYCADLIPLYRDGIFLVRRLNFPQGLAIPGGKRNNVGFKLESAVNCAIRELEEETGLKAQEINYFKRYDDILRDPRGHKISDVFYAEVHGIIRNEIGKTYVEFYSFRNLPSKDKFAFDHHKILDDFLKKYVGGNKNESFI